MDGGKEVLCYCCGVNGSRCIRRKAVAGDNCLVRWEVMLVCESAKRQMRQRRVAIPSYDKNLQETLRNRPSVGEIWSKCGKGPRILVQRLALFCNSSRIAEAKGCHRMRCTQASAWVTINKEQGRNHLQLHRPLPAYQPMRRKRLRTGPTDSVATTMSNKTPLISVHPDFTITMAICAFVM